MKTLFLAMGFMFIFEGIMPLAFPERWRAAIKRVLMIPADQLRIMAAIMVGVGLCIVWAINELV